MSLIVFVSLVVSSQASAQAGFGIAEKFNDHWSFSLEQQSVTEVGDLSSDPSVWQLLDLPHDWSVRLVPNKNLGSCQGYLPGGIGWYQKTFMVPSNAELGNNLFFYFEGVYNRSEVYFNGHLLGKRPNGYISFLYDATPFVKFDESNTIAVRVDHSRQFDSRWYTGSGIYRDVWLVRSQPVHIAQWGVFAYATDVSKAEATLNIETEIVNEDSREVVLTVEQTLEDSEGNKVGETSSKIIVPAQAIEKLSNSLLVKHPMLWNLENPQLYTLRTTVLEGSKRIDQSVVKTGFRDMQFDPDTGFSLNGKNLKMKGVCLHHDAGVLGSAVPRKVWKQRLLKLKSIGCNAIRTSHNPQAPLFYQLCDEIGLLVLDEAFDEWEFPKRKWLEGWNVGEPGFEGSYDFFEEWGEKDVADMVRRDRNHPCIFAWSIGNEVDYPNDPYSHPVLDGSAITQPMYGGYKPEQPDATRLGDIAKRLVAQVKKYDTSRPVTAALAGVVMSNETEYPGALDIVGYNYTESRYAEDHETYPDRVIYGSENRSDYGAWKAVVENDHIFGQFIWTGFDYLGESGRWPSRGLGTGLIDYAGFVKPRGAFRQALWAETPFIYLGTMKAPEGDWQSMDAQPVWNYEKGTLVRVLCYTNMEDVELILNGEKVGNTQSSNPESGIVSWDIPFEKGTLQVVGKDASGNEGCRDQIRTYGPATNLRVSVDTEEIDQNRGVAIVELEVLDVDGNRVWDANDLICCHIEGPARLLGFESGANHDMNVGTDAEHNAFLGRMIAYIEATGEEGIVTAHFYSEELPEAQIQLKVR